MRASGGARRAPRYRDVAEDLVHSSAFCRPLVLQLRPVSSLVGFFLIPPRAHDGLVGPLNVKTGFAACVPFNCLAFEGRWAPHLDLGGSGLSVRRLDFFLSVSVS